MARSGISGLAVTLAAAGGYLVYAGIRNVPLLAGLRELAGGKLPAGTPRTPTAVIWARKDTAVAGAHPEIAQGGLKYLGVPYKFGAHGIQTRGQFKGQMAFDCSGFVTVVLRNLGYALPNNTHTVSGQFLVWGGATTIGRSQCSAGDLVCYAGHIGIATDKDNMVNAAHKGTVVRVQKIWGSPLIRRIKSGA